ncbi:MAG: flippase [Actinomycetota bacterium]|nr:flippase [Actinomycetota bacterium]
MLALVSVPLATRYLGPGGYGTLSAVTALMAVLLVFADLGVNSVILRRAAAADSPVSLPELVRLSVTLTLLYVPILTAALFLLGHLLYPGAQYDLLRTALPAYALALFAVSMNTSLRPLFQERLRLGWTSAADVIGSAFSLVCLALIVHFRGPALLVLVAAALNPVVAFGVLLAFSFSRAAMRPLFRADALRLLVVEAAPVGASQLVSALYLRADVLLLSIIASQVVVGQYGLAYRLVATVAVVPVYVAATVFPQLARLRGNGERYRSALTRALVGTQLLAVPIAVGGALVAPDLVVLVAGRPFLPASLPLQILLFSMIFSYSNSLFGNSLIISNRSRQLLGLSIGCLALNVAANLLVIPAYGMTGAASVTLATEVFATGVAGFWAWRDLEVASLVTGLARLAVATSLMTGCVLILRRHMPLLLLVPLAGAVYAGTSELLGVRKLLFSATSPETAG